MIGRNSAREALPVFLVQSMGAIAILRQCTGTFDWRA